MMRRIFLCGLAAFAIVLLLAPVYVHSGYLWRYAPFVVFLTDAVIGCAVFVGLGAARTAVRHARLGPVKQGNPTFGSKTVTALAAITPILFAVGWVTGQTVNLRLLPPDSFSFVKALRAPEFQGANSAASNYALPFHDQSGGWSYLDPALLSGRIDLSESGFAIRRDTTYLWFADRATNRDYERPDLFICYISQTFQTALADLQSGLEAGNPWCTTLGTIPRGHTA